MERTVHQRRSRYYGIASFTVLLVVTIGSVLYSVSPASAILPLSGVEPRSLITGHLIAALQHHFPLHTTEDNHILQLSIALHSPHEAELDQLIAQQSDPHSPFYDHYLTPSQFTNLFGPSEATVDKVTAYLHHQGLSIDAVAPNHLLINASGSVAAIEHAFRVTIDDYMIGGRAIYAPINEPSVPIDMAGVITNVAGLSNLEHYARSQSVARSPTQGHYIATTGGYMPSELRTAYNIDPLFDAGIDGTGQTVALFELDNYNPADIRTYSTHYGIDPPPVTNVFTDGTTTAPGVEAIEVEMDMEILEAVAPGARQEIYIGKNSLAGINTTYNRIVNDNHAKVVSTSWGACESVLGEAEIRTLDLIFKQGVVQGQTFFAATGDAGAYDCADKTLSVDSPASDPHVISVGGTSLHLKSDSSYANESAWSCPTCASRSPQGTGSGGGLSSFFPRPSYQNGLNLTSTQRMIPDVSANADPVTSYSAYCTVAAANCPASGWITAGGTSATVALWAGIAADLNQYLARHAQPAVNIRSLYRLYHTKQLYPAYHDVASGNNLYYPATTGYDLATGMGSPNVWNIARDLVNAAS
ncbi:MAG: peptidase S53 [Chloroflexi bacterium]|nr:MAG: peptidase S53 [Chloroflexota bacterium]